MNRIIRLPSEAETKSAEERNQKPFFPGVGVWWKTQKGQVMLKLDLVPDAVFMLSEPKSKGEDDGF